MTSLRLRLAPLALLAACAGVPRTGPVANIADAPPPQMPSHLVASDFTALVDHKVLAPIDLPVLARGEDSFFRDGTEPSADGTLVITNAMPGGWSEDVYVDGAHRLWVVTRDSDFHAPPGVHIPATRIFSTTLSIPAGYVVGGTIRVVDSPEQLSSPRSRPVHRLHLTEA